MNTENNESKKKSAWDLILKVIIAVASALAGVLGGSAMNLWWGTKGNLSLMSFWT